MSEAWQHCQLQLAAHPGDFNLRNVAFEIAFIRADYESLRWAHALPADVLRDYPELANRAVERSWQTLACMYVAHLNGVKTGRDPEQLEAEVLKEAWSKRESLPFGMISKEGIHADKQVLTLLLLQDSFGGSHRKLLFDRAAKLAPNDTFILELKAKRLIADGEEAQAVEMYKKALKAKASETRIKYLKKELVEAEKMAEWRKRVGPRTDKKDGG